MSAYHILTSHGVTRLCHFTKFQSLTHIISSPDGVLASSSIRQDTKNFTDTARYDGELDYVCCSVQYPNSWFLEKARQSNTDKIFRDWVVIYINLSILNYRSAKFCPCNAAKDYGLHISDDMDNVDSIFAKSVSTFRYSRTANMLDSCPTDGQAEVLIKHNIPREYIIGIAVGNEDVATRVYSLLIMHKLEQIPLFIAPDVLTPSWSALIRNGHRPTEHKCNWSEED